MPRIFRLLKYLLFGIMVIACVECAPAKKNPWSQKKKQGSKVNASQLGRNKYYFSVGYQKKLTKNYKK